jgi:hypothetical protein
MKPGKARAAMITGWLTLAFVYFYDFPWAA